MSEDFNMVAPKKIMTSTTRTIQTGRKWYWSSLIGLFVGWLLGAAIIHVDIHCKENVEVTLDYNQNPLSASNETLDNGRVKQKLQPKRKFLYVAMMSADKFVPTRVRAAVQTWASSIRTWNRDSNVDVEIFAQSNTTVGVPIVKMPGVSDNVYPPQKKSFSMMRYVSDHHGTDYEWFLRLDDDAYVHIEHLESLLRRIDSSQPLYIGSPGFGRDDDDFVEDNMVYCMGGPGIVLSKTTLASLSPKLGECLRNNLMTEHEDIELGRCVLHHTGVGCTKSYEMGTLFKNNYNVEETDSEGLKPVFEEVAGHSATYHANKLQENQYALHATVMMKKIQKLRQAASDLEQDIEKMRKAIRAAATAQNDARFHRLPKSKSVIWQQITSGKHYSDEFVSRGILQPWVQVITELAREAAKTHYKDKKLHGKIERIHVDQVYKTISNYYSEYLAVIDMKHVSSGKEQTLTSAFRAKRRFLSLMMQEKETINFETVHSSIRKRTNYKSPKMKKVINFIVPLSGRAEAVKTFLHRLDENVLKKGILVNVKVAYFTQDENSTQQSENQLKNYLRDFQNKYKYLKFQFIEAEGQFSRGRGLQIGAESCEDDSLLFFCDIDMLFTADFFRRMLSNVVPGVAFYPIIFSQYDPHYVGQITNDFEIQENSGFWREYGYGMVALYKSDFDKAGGFDVKIEGWGLEDVYLATNVISRGVNVFRANDPNLVHLFHTKHCDPELSPQQYDGCLKTKASHFGPSVYHYKLLKGKPTELERLMEAEVTN